ncbi:hypothetical protein QLS71_005865 [Mariniflexile litorale]|uniref:Lipoprotein n=1 Tax=Mariniflexile litorale TaxID=3045158 RepID=A0AAU7EJ53_9FLAO|nr:hypothetical protein [Mariniflexile sp. KMM 9835]MDQ8211103.1 hypothetical protein [Mariniflexile sp. KMM 9835]
MKNLGFIILLLTVLSCGTKTYISKDVAVAEIEKTISKIDANKKLKETITEGALTDKEGFKDIGTFKYYVFFDENTNELSKIKNTEITSKTITEAYYFSDNKLIFITSQIANTPIKKIYIQNKRVISKEHVNEEEEKLLLNKANRFQKAFKKIH